MAGRQRDEPTPEPTPEPTSDGLVASTLAYVRTGDGEVVQVERGDAAPAGADPEHVEHLAGTGVFVSPQALAELDQHEKD